MDSQLGLAPKRPGYVLDRVNAPAPLLAQSNTPNLNQHAILPPLYLLRP